MAIPTLGYLEDLGLIVPKTSFALGRPALLEPTGQPRDAESFEQALEEAFSSALTKFDSLDIYFSSGQCPPEVSSTFVEELHQDGDLLPFLDEPEHVEAMRTFIRTAVGKRFGDWKKSGGARGSDCKTSDWKAKTRDVPLPWSSIDAYPEWVMNRIEAYSSADRAEQEPVRRDLEETLLRTPVLAAAIKYDGTCFGKMDTGDLVGRRLVLGTDCREYMKTSTAAAASCDVAALRRSLMEIFGADVAQFCVWGELMCNPNFYSYEEQGLHGKWICFGIVASFVEPDAAISQRLATRGLAHSMNRSGCQVRLMLCPALRQVLLDVGCDVAKAPFAGLTHAEVVSRAAASLRAGDREGLVFTFERSGGQASMRKWKNSAEGASARKKEAQLLTDCRGVCARLVSEGRLDLKIMEMVDTMRSVAEAETSPLKKGRGKTK